MKDSEIRALERCLEDLARKKGSLKILEWGSGGSTVHFTGFLKKLGVSYEWTSLEYNKEWHDAIAEKLKGDSTVKLVLFDAGNLALKQRNADMNEYILYPGTLGKKYDMILVDGRKRRRCLLEAKKLLSDGGTVFLHDAERTYYHPAFAEFPDGRFLGKHLWRGRIASPAVGIRLNNLFVNAYFLNLNAAISLKERAKYKLYGTAKKLLSNAK